MDRIHSELLFHDHQAARRAPALQDPQTLVVDDNAYLDHESWIRPAMDRLGDVRGQRILDFGCGHAMASIVLARRGAKMTAIDLSHGYLTEGVRRASANDVPIEFVQANGEYLPFADASFDRIWGNAVLHHLDLKRTAREIDRVLAPGGWAIFCEPWGGNPLLRFARRWLPYPGKGRTPDEMPLMPRDVRILREVFADLEIEGAQLLGMASRVLGQGSVTSKLSALDRRLLGSLPVLQRFCRYVVLTLEKS